MKYPLVIWHCVRYIKGDAVRYEGLEIEIPSCDLARCPVHQRPLFHVRGVEYNRHLIHVEFDVIDISIQRIYHEKRQMWTSRALWSGWQALLRILYAKNSYNL